MADETKKKTTIVVPTDTLAAELYRQELDQAKAAAEGKGPRSIVFSILDDLQKSQQYWGAASAEQHRLAFESDPTRKDVYHGIYQDRPYLLPFALIKRIHRTDDLIATILNVRSNHLSSFGRPRASRFDTGFDIVVDKKVREGLDDEAKKKLVEKVERAKKLLYTCGLDTGWSDEKKLTFPQCLKMITQDGLRFGRCAIEIIYQTDDPDKFHSFRPVDAGTIYKLAPKCQDAAQRLREASKKLLEDLGDQQFDQAKFDKVLKDWESGDFSWAQVIDNRMMQSFRAKEMVVHNFYPVTDIEYNGYPLTPLDTIINAVTTHINITQHNKLYFQTGRAARGMLIIQSDSVDRDTVENIKIQFNASINSVQNAWRMPVFGVGAQENIQWQPLDAQGSRDAEFLALSDANARTILAAFQMSPDEIPGYGHLSRASNQKSLSESNNEFKLEAARDVGLRPLILTIQDLINSRLFPLIDPELAEISCVVLAGLDADDPLTELERLQVELGIHATYNSILETVDKKSIPKEMGGDFPLNERFQASIEKYLTVGQILEFFFDVKGAKDDVRFAYVRDPLWMQWQQFQQTERQMAAQAEMQERQFAANQEQQKMMTQQQQAKEADTQKDQAGQEEPDLSSVVEQLAGMLSKSEKQLPTSRKRLLAQQRATVSKVLTQWEQDSEKFLREVLEEAERHSDKKEEK